MNNKARELGAIETHFANASGLYNPNHYTSAYDMAMIARGCYNNASFVNIDSTSSSYTIPATNERVSINLVESSGERNTTHISLIPSFSANVTRVIKDSSVNPVFPPLQYS